MKILKPFEQINSFNRTSILTGWLILLVSFWIGCSFGDTHLFPTPHQVINGFVDLWNSGLVVHIGASLSLCAQAVLISVLIGLTFAYSSTIPFLKSMGTFITKLRFLPLTGIAFYVAI